MRTESVKVRDCVRRAIETVRSTRPAGRADELRAMRILSGIGATPIVRELCDGPKSVTELARKGGSSLSRISHQLHKLLQAGAVKVDRSGRAAVYSLKTLSEKI